MPIKIFGSTHLDSKEKILDIIKNFNPDIIGIELDEFRFNILQNQNNVTQPVQEDKGIISKISNAISKKAKENNIQYGSDMINAGKYAVENNLKLIFVDRDINEIKRLMELIPENEKQGFMKELMEFEQQNINKEVNENDVLNELKTKYPVAFEFLITSRELYIANQIFKTMLNYPAQKILVFLGKGHEVSIKKMIGVKDG